MAKMPSKGRSPTAHRTKAQASRQWKDRMSGPNAAEERRKNKQWKQARRDAVKAGKVKTGDGKDVTHKKPLSKGGSNAKSNLGVGSPSKNRGHGLSPGGNRPGRRLSRAAKKRGR